CARHPWCFRPRPTGSRGRWPAWSSSPALSSPWPDRANMPGRMAGRVALVTGGGGGIGEATGRLFAEEGAAVALVDSDKAAAEAAATGIAQVVAGARVSAIAADLTSEPESQRVVDATLAAFGALHTLVNVAGVRLYTPLAEADAKGWEFIFGVNVLATAYC